MKKLLLFIIFFLILLLKSESQTDFGVKGGVNITFFKVDEGNFGTNPSEDVGFYGGFFLNLALENNFNLQPELLYIHINDFKFLNTPIYLKYDIDKNFDILIGPSLNYFFDFFSNKFKVRADLGFAYNFSQNLNINMKYTLGFQELAPNMIFLGLGYKLK